MKGTLINLDGGDTISWSFKAFKEWKKDLDKKCKEKYGESIKDIVPDSRDRETLYLKLLGLNDKHRFIFNDIGEEVGSITKEVFNKIQAVLHNTA